MQQFLSNGGLSKMLWLILMFIMTLGSMAIAGWEIVNMQPVNPIILALLSGVLSHGATIGGHILSDQQHGGGTNAQRD